MNKKLTAGLVAGLSVLALVGTIAASAQTAPTTTTPPQPMILNVNRDGKVLLRGTIDSIGSGALTVKSWGGDWTVNVGASTQILPAAAGNDLAKFSAGDFVGVAGTVSQSGAWTINATLVRDWTYRNAVIQQERQNQQSARQTMRANAPRTYQGIASNVASGSLTLTAANGITYTVDIAANAKILNKNWLSIAATDIQNGDTVRAWGTNASGTIAASIVRDVSIPRTTGH